jgi:hypothetical protein
MVKLAVGGDARSGEDEGPAERLSVNKSRNYWFKKPFSFSAPTGVPHFFLRKA